MEIALIIVIAVLVICLVFLAVSRRKSDNVEALQAKVDQIATAQNNLRESLNGFQLTLKGVETKVVESAGTVKESIMRDFGGVRESLTRISTELDAYKKLQKEIEESSRRIEAVVVGGKARGRAGENILEEAFKKFPPEIIETNFRVNGHPVEYALVLRDGRRVPIDSKWTSPELIESLDKEADPSKREEIVGRIEKALRGKVKEVTKYIEPSVTVTWGIAAVPDSVFGVCRGVHLEAFKDRVIVMPYSLTIIYLLSLYQIHAQYCGRIDLERLQAYLDQIQQDLSRLDDEMENKIVRGNTMVRNAYEECKRIIGEMNQAAAYLKVLNPPSQASNTEKLTQNRNLNGQPLIKE